MKTGDLICVLVCLNSCVECVGFDLFCLKSLEVAHTKASRTVVGRTAAQTDKPKTTSSLANCFNDYVAPYLFDTSRDFFLMPGVPES